ncbi:MAG TPA: alanine racemase [Gammaproteobacteria bacterium]|nr:alanine racemase [Gammaproteobacteria bacterium]
MSLAYITIDIPALRHNFQRVKTLTAGRFVLAMLKANAYGHSIEHIAKALPEADAFGVASLAEGLQIRSAFVKQPVVLMQGVLDQDELDQAILHNFDLVIHQAFQIEMLQRRPEINSLSVWLKINTGMNRLGFEPEEAVHRYQALQNCSIVKKPIGLMTHLAQADNLNSPATVKQLQLFQTLTKNLAGPCSIANSAGILGWQEAHADWVRPGVILYGVSPFAGTSGMNYDLWPVMTLSTHLIAIQQLRKGEQVGYGGTWTAPTDMLIGVAGLGYADGYPQFAKTGTPVLVQGTRCPLVGRVSMDMITIDLRDHPHPKIGGTVTLWGTKLPIETVSQHCDTSPYELLCRVTTRARLKTISFADQAVKGSETLPLASL